MAIYGYHRTSTKEQHLDRGCIEINEYCKTNHIILTEIFTDQQTGKNFDRPEYQFLKKRILPGDILIITEADRFGRNKKEILNELRYYQDKGVRVIILEIPTTTMDYSKMDSGIAKLLIEAINNMLIEMFAVLAQAEIEKKEKRQKEGIAAKKLRGEWDDYGRPHVIDYSVFVKAYKEVECGSITPTECRKQLGMSHATFYRYRDKYINSEKSDG